MGIAFSIDGLDDAIDTLGRLNEDRIMQAMRSGMWKGLEMIRSEAAYLAPADTGQLRDSIKSRVNMGKGAIQGEVYVGAQHGIFVEMGTGPRGEANHAGVKPEWLGETTYSPKGWYAPIKEDVRYVEGMPARPFLYPAYKAREGEAKEEIRKALRQLVQNGG